MGSHYLTQVQREVERQLTQARAVHKQMCLDAAIIAANEVRGALRRICGKHFQTW